MKISLQISDDLSLSGKAAQARALERDILAARRGDWEARKSVMRVFLPLLRNMAEKQTDDPVKVNELIEMGQAGLCKAIRKYRRCPGPEQFQIFALDFIEQAMQRQRGGVGLLARLLGR